jgi:hypothetical protein
MAIISRVGSSSLEGAKRIDAEYYQPRFLDLMATQAKCPYSKRPLARLCSKIDVGFVGPMAHAYTESGVPLLQTQNVKEFVLGFERLIYIQEWFHHLLRKSQVFKGDILIARSGSIGKAALVLERDPQPLNSSDIIIIRPTAVKATLLCTYLNCKFGQAQIERMSSGGLQGHINLGSLETLQVPIFGSELTTMVESKVLAGVDLISEAQANYTEAERLLLSELGLQDWKPTPALAYARNYSQTVGARRVDAEHFQPKYAELRARIRSYANGYLKITDIAKNSDETIEPRAEPEKDFNYVELADINQVIGTIESANTIKGKDAPSRARMLLRIGDVIASTVEGSLDKVALVSEEHDGAIGSTGFFVLRPRTVPSGYLLALAKSILVREQMSCESSGTILAAVPGRSLQNIIVPNLPPDKRDEIARLVQQSHTARREAKALLEKAKRAVEIAIEESEERAIEFIG